MIIKEVSIGLGATHNLGDFSSARADVKISADVHDESEIAHVLSRCQSLLIEALRSAHPAFDPGAYERSAIERDADNTPADVGKTVSDADDEASSDAGKVISFASRASDPPASDAGDVYDQCLAAMKEIVARDGTYSRVKAVLTQHGLTRFTRKVGEEKARSILKAVRAELDA